MRSIQVRATFVVLSDGERRPITPRSAPFAGGLRS